MIAACIRSEDRRARKPRLQILAAKFDQEIDTETMEGLMAAGWTKKDIDWIRREHGGWWQPWCIRASSGHSDFGFARPAELCNILFPNMSDRWGGAFHVTKPSALEGIILRGIVPGGNDSARRLAVHFGVFAPWDSENISTKTAMHAVKEGDDFIAIYVPTRKLSVFQSGLTSGGTIVAFQTIPFKEIRAIWRFKSMKKGPVKEVKRIYSRPGFKDAVGVTPADFLGNLNNFLDDEDSADADILRNMVVDARQRRSVRCLGQIVGRDPGFAQQIHRLPRGRPIKHFQQGMPSVRYRYSKGVLLLHGMPMQVHFHRQARDPRGRRRGQTIRHHQCDGGSETSSARSKGGC